MTQKQSKLKNLGNILLYILTILVVIAFVYLLFNIIFYDNCYYELKDGTICKLKSSNPHETKFKICSDGYEHIGGVYKEICK